MSFTAELPYFKKEKKNQAASLYLVLSICNRS